MRSTKGGGPALNRRRGTRGGGGGGFHTLLSRNALMVLAALCVSIFTLGLVLGMRAVLAAPPTETPLSKTDAIKSVVREGAREVVADARKLERKLGDAAIRAEKRVEYAAWKAGRQIDNVERNVIRGAVEVEKKIERGLRGAGGTLRGHGMADAVDENGEEFARRMERENMEEAGRDADLAAEGVDAGDAPRGGIIGGNTHEAHDIPIRAGEIALPPPQNDGKGPFPPEYMGSAPPPNKDPSALFASWSPPGGDRFPEWKDGATPYAVTPELMSQSDELARGRREYVKAAMRHAWAGYKKYAFGMDELLPQTKRSHNNWGGMGTTLVDSLDTLWLMGMKDEFYEARDWVRDHLDHTHVGGVSVFETTIRSLGGLLSAYDWSGDSAFLEKADDLGSRLVKAFDSPSGVPYGHIELNRGTASNFGWAGGNAILSEIGTLQVEFRYLAKATGKRHYATKSERAFEQLKSIEPDDGLYPLYVKNGGPKPSFSNAKISFGAMGDSLYEYMLKVWLQGGRTESMYRDMYDKSIQGMHDELLQKSSPNGLTYIADKVNGRLDHKMDHLVCFMGGLMALGAYTDPLGFESERAQRDLKTAKELTYTCYQMYARTKTGISPEFVAFAKRDRDFSPGSNAPYYILRPETVESFFILNKLTGDPIYREWGWEVFQSIERYCRTEVAYGGLHNVDDAVGKPEDRMESFFLAETIKYLYLLFDPDTEVDVLNKHVFNTEAHPMRIFPLLDEVGGAAAA
eukprot:CAMPEP_0183300398 /NCGR_PEP_ID=MMETSP0160_2-20130417/6841_1 /TAXON_ID=2839 ORGANISM="Odontella Sinensis, Strain Grunow 1884" /NCGR_SAMPLE_ID=MMETSP0160_2 /ASSEMBLY_ACC=CAM_ASM_000250 /LENGTH=744 /DNA_ID=CAMNT_0025462807 /DNA_START=48 /DNA_END=2282 /DNA_ORIENTATION=-